MKKTGLIITVIGLLFFCHVEGWGADWKLYATSELGDHYYDTSIIRLPNRLIRVWTKLSHTDKGRLLLTVKLGKQFDNIDHEIALDEISCSDKKWHSILVTDYFKDGVTDSSETPGEWVFIIPDSAFDVLYKEVCK